jgi:hypothetical protein
MQETSATPGREVQSVPRGDPRWSGIEHPPPEIGGDQSTLSYITGKKIMTHNSQGRSWYQRTRKHHCSALSSRGRHKRYNCCHNERYISTRRHHACVGSCWDKHWPADTSHCTPCKGTCTRMYHLGRCNRPCSRSRMGFSGSISELSDWGSCKSFLPS